MEAVSIKAQEQAKSVSEVVYTKWAASGNFVVQNHSGGCWKALLGICNKLQSAGVQAVDTSRAISEWGSQGPKGVQ